jgi:hypothetical protein
MWFQRKCPVRAEQKAWIESRMGWLSDQFGRSRMVQSAVILPTVEFFPEPYSGTEDDARLLLGRVCCYMGIDPERIRLGFYSEQGPDLGEQFRPEGYRRGTAGLHFRGEQPAIWIETRQLDNPVPLVATMAHELGHVHLIDDGRISRDVEDHEPLTDLLTVYFGLGIFTANSYLRERWKHGLRSSSWSLARVGYLSAPEYGYALSLFAWSRGDQNPAWAMHLRPDIRHPFRQGLRYLLKTRDSAFRPNECQ